MREFKDGYIAGWRWIGENDDLPTIPACAVRAGDTAYRAGVMRGVYGACDLTEAAAARSENVDSVLHRALAKKRPRS